MVRQQHWHEWQRRVRLCKMRSLTWFVFIILFDVFSFPFSLSLPLPPSPPRSQSKTVRQNLEAVLGVQFCKRDEGAMSAESLQVECGICYSYSIASNTTSSILQGSGRGVGGSSTSIPDQMCPNPKCMRLYHVSCLVDWLQALPSTRSSFGSLFGTCPYCQDPLAVKSSNT